MMTLRRRVALALDTQLRREPGLSWTNWAIIAAIASSTLVAILETEDTIVLPYARLFYALELLFLVLFTLEYAARVWSSIENERHGSRWRYVLRPVALLDLVVIVTIAFTLIGVEGALLRMVRLVRLLRVAKLGKYSDALANIGAAIAARRFELFVSLCVAFGLLLVSAAALYLLEGQLQPESFGSIPRAMWWAMATLTTVGYGDVVPITAAGRFFAMLTAVTGVGLIAMPAGILASAFSEAIQKRNAVGGEMSHSEPVRPDGPMP